MMKDRKDHYFDEQLKMFGWQPGAKYDTLTNWKRPDNKFNSTV